MREPRMKNALAAMVITAALPHGTSIAWAKSPCAHGLTPEKWSSLMYGLWLMED